MTYSSHVIILVAKLTVKRELWKGNKQSLAACAYT